MSEITIKTDTIQPNAFFQCSKRKICSEPRYEPCRKPVHLLSKFSLDVLEQLATVGQSFFKGVINLGGALFSTKLSASRGAHQLFVATPFYLLELPATIWKSIGDNVFYLDHEAPHDSSMEKTSKSANFLTKIEKKAVCSLSTLIKIETAETALDIPFALLRKTARIVETIVKGLINVIGALFSEKYTVSTGLQQLLYTLPLQILTTPAIVYRVAIQSLYLVTGHSFTWDSCKNNAKIPTALGLLIEES